MPGLANSPPLDGPGKALNSARFSRNSIKKKFKNFCLEKSVKSFLKHKSCLDRVEEAIRNKHPRQMDTVGVVVVDARGNVAAGCSSGGLALKVPGRAGQAAMYGCGVWAENGEQERPSVAVSTTGCGEHLMRTSLAKTVATHVPGSPCSTEALHNTLHRHFLGRGFLVFLREAINVLFSESKFLRSVSKPLGGVLYLEHSTSADGGWGEVQWAHTTATMCVGYMGCDDRLPHTFVSRLPDDVTPGKGVIVHGASFRTTVSA